MRAKRPAPAAYISPLTGQSSWARNAAIGATNSGGMAGDSPSPPAIRVIAAGAIRLTAMPCFFPATARLRVSPTTAALAVAYDTLFDRPNIPLEVVITMRPYPAAHMCGHAARAVLKEPTVWTAR